MTENHILISGCSGGGKSTLLDALKARGFATVSEPGRRVLAQERATGGDALPWVNLNAFARRAFEMAEDDLAAHKASDELVFFDRGLIDAAVALAFSGGPSYSTVLGAERLYAQHVFLAPPWPEIFKTDSERQHRFEEARAEYRRLVAAFAHLGYDACELPKISVKDRVAFVLSRLRMP